MQAISRSRLRPIQFSKTSQCESVLEATTLRVRTQLVVKTTRIESRSQHNAPHYATRRHPAPMRLIPRRHFTSHQGTALLDVISQRLTALRNSTTGHFSSRRYSTTFHFISYRYSTARPVTAHRNSTASRFVTTQPSTTFHLATRRQKRFYATC